MAERGAPRVWPRRCDGVGVQSLNQECVRASGRSVKRMRHPQWKIGRTQGNALSSFVPSSRLSGERPPKAGLGAASQMASACSGFDERPIGGRQRNVELLDMRIGNGVRGVRLILGLRRRCHAEEDVDARSKLVAVGGLLHPQSVTHAVGQACGSKTLTRLPIPTCGKVPDRRRHRFPNPLSIRVPLT